MCARLPTPERQLLSSELELLEELRRRIAESDGLVKQLGQRDLRVDRVRTIPGLGAFCSVLVVQEIGDIRRFLGPEKLRNSVPLGEPEGGPSFSVRVLRKDRGSEVQR